MGDDQSEADGCERATATEAPGSARRVSFGRGGVNARQTDRGGDGMNGNEAQTEGPDAAVEKIERGTWLSRTSSRDKDWKSCGTSRQLDDGSVDGSSGGGRLMSRNA